MTDNATADVEYTPVNNPVELATYYEALSQPGVASLRLATQPDKEHPLVLLEQEEQDYLLFDLTAIRDVAPPLRRGGKFLMTGYTPGGRVRSNPMQIREFASVDGRLLAYADWPTEINVQQRRASFRATLRIGMNVGVSLWSKEEDEETGQPFELQGDLKDLSATGCLAEFFMQDGVSKVLPDLDTEIELYFPNGTTFKVPATVRHIKTDNDRQVLAVGFEFSGANQAQERELWNYVREIEREASRSAGDSSTKTPSELFAVKDENDTRLSRRHGHEYATPMARRMARVAGYLDAQMVLLKQGQSIDSQQLSIHADRLVDMVIDHREESLFAVYCIHRESRWIQHSLSVAVRMIDLLMMAKAPKDLLKSVAAVAMVHDLGKGMLPPDIWRATTLSTAVYEEMKTHVEVLKERLEEVKWIAPVVQQNVLVDINERLDGSGYPNGKRDTEIGQLARMGAVIDAIDALQRKRPDRPAISALAAAKFVASRQELYDPTWVQRYQNRFGVLPVGTLVRFEKGEYAWVVGLDRHMKVERVRLSPHKFAPDKDLGEPIQGAALRDLGRIRDIVVPEINI